MPGALDGVRVLEFSMIVAGPVCGLTLADLGADVVKVEPPGGEPHRRNRSVVPGESKLFQNFNRGKRGLVVDLQTERGRELIYRLMPNFDVAVVNYRLGVAEQLGIGYEMLREHRPDLIFVESSGFGSHGPEAHRPASDIVAQAYTGLMAGAAKLEPDGAPQQVGLPIADYLTGIATAMGVAAALYHRERTGEGQKVSGSLLRSAVFAQSHLVMREPVTDATVRDRMVEAFDSVRRDGGSYGEMVEAREGFRAKGTQFSLYYSGYQAKDGGVVLGALSPANRDAMRQVLGLEGERCDEPDYDAYDPENLAEGDRWKQVIRERMAERTVAEWIEAFDAVGAPASPVHFPEEMSDDPQVEAEGLMVEQLHSITGQQRVVGPIVELSATPTAVQRASPATGEHSAEVLAEAGLTSAEIDALIASGVVESR